MALKKHQRKYTYRSEEFKIRFVKEYLYSGRLRKDVKAEYEVHSDGLIYNWIEKYGDRILAETVLPQPVSKPKKTKVSSAKSEEEQLKKRIQELETQLEDARLQAMLYEKMVDIAEDKLHLPIRKKFGPQPSSKSNKKSK